MTKSVGFDEFWDDGGGRKYHFGKIDFKLTYSLAVTPDEAAVSLIEFIDKFDISKTGEYWAPRGPR